MNSKFIKTYLILTISILLLGVYSCTTKEKMTAELLLEKVNRGHQTSNIMGKKITFTFRDHEYSLERTQDYYSYTRKKDSVVDVLDSQEGYQRLIHGKVVEVPDSMAVKYANSVNSVLYFFQLPYVLKDPAVNPEYLGETTIKDTLYHALKVTFAREQGGEDFEDEYRYWINAKTFEIDYFAYSYQTDGGGIRFREAIHKRRREGILFQDYRNYKPSSLEISLDSLPELFEQQKLTLVSEIINTSIEVD